MTGRLSLWIDLCAQDMPALEALIARHIAPLDLEGLEVQMTLQTLVESRPPDIQAVLPDKRSPSPVVQVAP